MLCWKPVRYEGMPPMSELTAECLPILTEYKAGERQFAAPEFCHDPCLKAADLRGADFSGLNFRATYLEEVDFTGSKLRCTQLDSAYLNRTKFVNADLVGATIDLAMVGADFTGADLSGARFRGGSPDYQACFDRVTLGGTIFVDVNLREFCRAKGVIHRGPSSFDERTILRSFRDPLLKPFLREAGMSDVLVEYAISCAETLDPAGVFSLLQSTFISYGGPDEAFAMKLNDELKRQGVRTYLFKVDASPGARLHNVMRDGVNNYDRTILICSQTSLQRPGVLYELDQALSREARDSAKEYLIPVRLDDAVFTWVSANPGHAQEVQGRVVSDFTDHQDDSRFRAEVAKLIAVLCKPPSTILVDRAK